MRKRLTYLFLALMLPVAVSIAIARIALPEMVATGEENTTEKTKTVQATEPAPFGGQQYRPRVVPETLDQARKMTTDRLVFLQKLDQVGWEKERQTLIHRNPPENLTDAIAAVQLRLSDLNRMTHSEWVMERKRLQARADREAARFSPSPAKD